MSSESDLVERCAFCSRTVGEHSHDTRDICNVFVAKSEQLRCNICGFLIDNRFEATKPTIEFGMAGRTKKSKPSDEDEAYEIGKRDGYEDAIQDLDLATGGDGEFKGSTIPGQTVDVPAMKARVLAELATLRTERDDALALAAKLNGEVEAMRAALTASLPLLESLHSVIPLGDARRTVLKAVMQVRVALLPTSQAGEEK